MSANAPEPAAAPALRRTRIRVESDQQVVTNAKIFYLPEDPDEPEVDISRAVQGVDLHLHVGELATADLRLMMVEGRVEAEVDKVILTHLKPKSRLWQRRRTAGSRLKRWSARLLGRDLLRELLRVEERERRLRRSR